MKSSLAHIIIWISVCVVTLIGYGFWYSVIVGKSASVADLQKQIDSKIEIAGRVAAARTALAEIVNDESAVQSYFVPETEVVPFIDDLEARARAQTAEMKVLSVSVGNDAKQSTLILSVRIRGTFDSIMRTVGAIEYSPYDLSLSKLSIGKETKNVWNADVELIVGSVPTNAPTSTKETMQKVISLYYP